MCLERTDSILPQGPRRPFGTNHRKFAARLVDLAFLWRQVPYMNEQPEVLLDGLCALQGFHGADSCE